MKMILLSLKISLLGLKLKLGYENETFGRNDGTFVIKIRILGCKLGLVDCRYENELFGMKMRPLRVKKILLWHKQCKHKTSGNKETGYENEIFSYENETFIHENDGCEYETFGYEMDIFWYEIDAWT